MPARKSKRRRSVEAEWDAAAKAWDSLEEELERDEAPQRKPKRDASRVRSRPVAAKGKEGKEDDASRGRSRPVAAKGKEDDASRVRCSRPVAAMKGKEDDASRVRCSTPVVAALAHRATQQPPRHRRHRRRRSEQQHGEVLGHRAAAGIVAEWESAAVLKQQRLFDRRAERACWLTSSCGGSAPRLAVSSHGGDVVLSASTDTDEWTTEWEQLVVGKGKGGAVLDLAFPAADCGSTLVTCGHDGAIRKHDVEEGAQIASLSTADLGSTTRPGFECDHWFTCLSVAPDGRQILGGCNQGWLTCLDGGCDLSWRCRLHSTGKSKLTAVARHPQLEHIIATGATDRKLRLWDLRTLGSSPGATTAAATGSGGKGKALAHEPIVEWSFESSVNGICWSPCGGHRLLVTAQQRELHVLEQPLLRGAGGTPSCRAFAQHAHRFYQHLVNFRASWHPASDRVLCIGRYPEKGDADKTQGIDLYTVARGRAADDSAAAAAGVVAAAGPGGGAGGGGGGGGGGGAGLECVLAGRLGTCMNGVQAGKCEWSPDGTHLASLTGHSVVVYKTQ